VVDSTFAVLVFLCCAPPLLWFSGISLATLWNRWPVLGGALAVVGLIGLIWNLRRCFSRQETERRRDASEKRPTNETNSQS
jgi:hypothetical protein